MPIRVRSNTSQRLPHFIRDWREHRKLTQTQLAKGIGTTAATISRMENGWAPYTQDTLELIASVLRTTPAALISRRPGREDQQLWQLLQGATADQRSQIRAVVHALVRGGSSAGEALTKPDCSNGRSARQTSGLSRRTEHC